MIELKNITKAYGDNEHKFYALSHVSCSFQEGKRTAIVGKSGSGKSTRLNLIGALDRPTDGEVLIDGKDISKRSSDELSSYRNENIGFVFQSFYLDERSTVFQNVEMPLRIKGIKKDQRKEMVEGTLRSLNREKKESRLCRDLSGGEKQRVAIARALINNPNIILADEPTGNLDSVNGQQILGILKQETKKGKTVILVTHNREDAKKYADDFVFLSDGKIKDESI